MNLLKLLLLLGDAEKARSILQDPNLTDAEKIQLLLSLLSKNKPNVSP